MWPMNHGWGMGLWWLLIVAVAVLGGWALTRAGRRGGEVSAEELLRRRYAAGEIDETEYRRRLETLRGNGPSTDG